eukprot:TRINITY_DN3127_c0_g1_i2.p2 TRINITY_DN3127_c0_g1~~TRINITY_DN3127_c0_g1_i2.p2  ORF type:complete len:148 (+),score=46.18 TRINITY_DN3127_c0_g1_i2:469-912(+)
MEYAIELLSKYYNVKKMFENAEEIIHLPLVCKINQFLTDMFESFEGYKTNNIISEKNSISNSPHSTYFNNQKKLMDNFFSDNSVLNDWRKYNDTFSFNSENNETEEDGNSSTYEKDEKSSSEIISFSEDFKENYPNVFKYKFKKEQK